MTLNELIQGLSKLTQVAGELPVIIHDVESETDTVLHSIGINIDPGGAANGKVTINHAPSNPAPEPAAAGADSNPPTGPTDNNPTA